MICACLSSYMHIYPDRSGYKLYVAIILATGSCVLKYDPPLSTVDSSVSKQALCTHTFHCMHVYNLNTCVYTDIVFYIYCVYIRPFFIFEHVSSVGFLVRNMRMS